MNRSSVLDINFVEGAVSICANYLHISQNFYNMFSETSYLTRDVITVIFSLSDLAFRKCINDFRKRLRPLSFDYYMAYHQLLKEALNNFINEDYSCNTFLYFIAKCCIYTRVVRKNLNLELKMVRNYIIKGLTEKRKKNQFNDGYYCILKEFAFIRARHWRKVGTTVIDPFPDIPEDLKPTNSSGTECRKNPKMLGNNSNESLVTENQNISVEHIPNAQGLNDGTEKKDVDGITFFVAKTYNEYDSSFNLNEKVVGEEICITSQTVEQEDEASCQIEDIDEEIDDQNIDEETKEKDIDEETEEKDTNDEDIDEETKDEDIDEGTEDQDNDQEIEDEEPDSDCSMTTCTYTDLSRTSSDSNEKTEGDEMCTTPQTFEQDGEASCKTDDEGDLKDAEQNSDCSMTACTDSSYDSELELCLSSNDEMGTEPQAIEQNSEASCKSEDEREIKDAEPNAEQSVSICTGTSSSDDQGTNEID